MSDPHTAIAFVHAFHADLTRFFSGSGPKEATWEALRAACPADMTLVYPSGSRLTGQAFLDSIASRWGSSPGFSASIEDGMVVAEADTHVVVSYVEVQSGATASATTNRRSALAVVEPCRNGWQWRFIQETDLA